NIFLNERLFIYICTMRLRDEQKELLIKQKAIDMIVSEGLEGFGVNKLAKAADVAPGTIYIYYRNKEDLIMQLCLEVSSNILRSSIRGLQPEMSFGDGMRLQWKNRYQYAVRHPQEVQFIEKVRYSSIYEKITEALTVEYGSALGAFIQASRKRNELAEMSFEMYWSLAFAPLYQLINFSQQITAKGTRRFVLTEAKLNEALHRVLKGLKP
ncbi:MAG TPA: TetR/AcrR family transcriptional regulator, partial [Chitinophaga sp.]|uniref:TetR/AcrR family transcriptional regulator n=1 Tax=Chitinophaga sp. TaxID=1869181 RepID=UPI002B51DC8A